jgi:hypothetical protein
VHNAYLRPGEDSIGEFNDTPELKPTKQAIEEAVEQGAISESTSGPSIAMKPGVLTTMCRRMAAKVHHAPAAGASPLEYDEGPAWRMETSDHALTESNGPGSKAEAYRELQRTMISNGDFWDAFEMDVADTRSIAKVMHSSPAYYDNGIAQARAYASSLDPAELFPVQGAD